MGCSSPNDIIMTDTYKAPNIHHDQDKGILLSLCSRKTTADDVIKKHAFNACPTNTETVQKLSQDTTWNSCPLLQKKRTTFLCIAGEGGFPVQLIHKLKNSELEGVLKTQ